MGISHPLPKIKYHLPLPTDNTLSKKTYFAKTYVNQKLSQRILRCSWLKHCRILDWRQGLIHDPNLTLLVDWA